MTSFSNREQFKTVLRGVLEGDDAALAACMVACDVGFSSGKSYMYFAIEKTCQALGILPDGESVRKFFCADRKHKVGEQLSVGVVWSVTDGDAYLVRDNKSSTLFSIMENAL